MSDPTFEPFPKISRLSREVIITEKIDGTNAQVYIGEPGPGGEAGVVRAGSRTRWLTPGKQDNFGFAAWVRDHEEELRTLGPGRHFGEWWGCGIQRGYGLSEKRFSLFNVHRWSDQATRPACVGVVPLLARLDDLDSGLVRVALDMLRVHGSAAAPGYMKPEGIVVFHTASSTLYKKTIEGDESPKGKAAA